MTRQSFPLSLNVKETKLIVKSTNGDQRLSLNHDDSLVSYYTITATDESNERQIQAYNLND